MRCPKAMRNPRPSMLGGARCAAKYTMSQSQYQRPPPTSDDKFNPAELPPSNAVAVPSGEPVSQDMAAVLEALRMQNVWLERIAVMLRAERAERPMSRVKIEDINMPLWHMVGLIIKFNLASSPVLIVMAILLVLAITLCGGATLLAALGTALQR